MTTEELSTLDNYIKQNCSFAIYRLPNEETLRFVMQESGPVRSVKNLAELNGLEGFVIAPFQTTSEQPAFIIRPDIEFIPAENNIKNIVSSFQDETDFSKPENISGYKDLFEEFIIPLKNKELSKVVLSRKKVVVRPENFSPAHAFYSACRQYTRSYVYLLHTPHTGTWLGSTPEMLLSGQGDSWQTVALAGTATLQNGELPTEWNHKNKEEQHVVENYITGQLATLGIKPKIKGPYAVRAAHLAHLKSDFCFHLPDTEKLGDLLSLLHPTPAIAGIPKDTAIRFITKCERYNREWYSGFLGYLSPQEKTDLYVNLRCMQIKRQQLILYAGSGLLEDSQVAEEWQETEDKLQTMLLIINN